MGLKDEVLLLREVPLFASTQVAHLQVLAFSSEKIKVRAGEYLVRQGERSGSGFLIRKGAAEAFAEKGGKAGKIARLERGAFIGELALVAGLPHRVSVRAVSSLMVLRISHDLFMRVCGEFPEFGQQVLANMLHHFSCSMAELERVRETFDAARSFK
jgi:CRP-like cAMP-binding protein